MDAWERLLRDEREALDFLLGEEFGMSTVVRHYQHGRLELDRGKWDVYVETDQGVEFLDTASTLAQAEALYYSWWEA